MVAPVAGGEIVKVLVLGASGIVGQHMRLCVPDGVEPIWYRQTADPITNATGDLLGQYSIGLLTTVLVLHDPDVIVNLAGESSVDAVERDPESYRGLNVGLPLRLADWCASTGKRLIHISSQAVWSGKHAPYPASYPDDGPVNEYGHQKNIAEMGVVTRGQTVVRLSFILGIRPLPHVGRQNPLEAMLAGQSPQVSDRWFSPLMAMDAAQAIWREVTDPSGKQVVQVGAERWSRYELAQLVNPDVKPCSHDDFPGLAPRPIDTTYQGNPVLDFIQHVPIRLGIDRAIRAAKNDREIELALFFGLTYQEAWTRLNQGFGPLHNAVSDDWRSRNPQTDAEILDFYRKTETYIWELSAYHADPGWNYAGMCEGIATRLKNEPNCSRVLCLGDGIGDVTLALHRAGFDAWYHDLYPSRTAEYAAFRFWRQTGRTIQAEYSDSRGNPCIADGLDAVVSLDYLEHVPNVEEWVRAIHAALRPGGLFCAQNAFACGSGPDGAMPMHLAVNDRFETDWDPLLTAVGFDQLAPQWYRKI